MKLWPKGQVRSIRFHDMRHTYASVTSDHALHERLKFLQNAVGGVPGPLGSFLVLRGLKTLHVHMQRHAENALAVAKFLEGHAQEEKVTYPGMPSHPQHALALRQLKGFGGMLTFLIRGGLEQRAPSSRPCASSPAPSRSAAWRASSSTPPS
jgi:cystathionine beta-lyase/cystathionine gamma-synthase